jgi:hypothetical protein
LEHNCHPADEARNDITGLEEEQQMRSIDKKLTPLVIFVALWALQWLAKAGALPSSSQDVLKLTIVADTDTNKALAWL